jgi:hypothetical protein
MPTPDAPPPVPTEAGELPEGVTVEAGDTTPTGGSATPETVEAAAESTESTESSEAADAAAAEPEGEA